MADARKTEDEASPADRRIGLDGLRSAKELVGSVLVIAAVVSIIYSNTLEAEFFFDDSLLFRDKAVWEWRLENLDRRHRPVGVTTFAINYALHKYQLWGYHATNIAIHVLASCALLGVARRTLTSPRLAPRYGRSANFLALAIALVRAAHPLQTQSVTYVVQRFESLMGLFFLLTIYCLIRGATAAPPRGGGYVSVSGFLWYGCGLLCCGLGLGTKEVMAAAPIMTLWYDRVFLAPSWRELFRKRWPFYLGMLVVIGYFLKPTTEFVLEGLMQQWFPKSAPAQAKGPTPAPAPIPAASAVVVEGVTPLSYLRSQPGVIVHDPRLSVWPTGLCTDYGWPVAKTFGEIVPPALAILACLAGIVWSMWKWPALGFVGGWFFVILAPMSTIVPIRDLCFEHRMYLPLASVVTLVVLGVYEGLRRWGNVDGEGPRAERSRLLAIWLLMGVVAVLGWLTLDRNFDYANEVRMWTDVTLKRPLHPRGHYNLAESLVQVGRVRESILHYERAVALKPTHAPYQLGLGAALRKLGRYDEALPYIRAALRLQPNYADAQAELNIIRSRRGVKERSASRAPSVLAR